MMTAFEWAIPLIGAAIAGIGALWLRWSGKRIGKAKERQDAIQEDVENAKRIRERADAARADTGSGDAVDRLRERHPGNLRD